MDLIKAFRQSEVLSPLDEKELNFLVERGITQSYKKGDFLFKKGEEANELRFIISGRFRIFLVQKDEHREVSMLEPGDLTGVLPYSRMTHHVGYGKAVEDAEVYSLYRGHFREMIVDHPPLAQALVHHMATRIRTFTAMRMQNEKLISLGKLSAGLAHELNNPAAAMVRSSEALTKHLKLLPENFKMVMKAKLDPEVVDRVNDWLFALLKQESPTLSLLQKNELEDEVVDILEEYEMEDPYELAGEIVEFGLQPDDIRKLHELVGGDDFETVIHWVVNNITTERMVEEINASATRIASLIRSIKEYSHMDRTRDRQPVDVNQGIESTLTMLKHKARKNKVDIDLNLEKGIPLIDGFPGELNQVWTNIIDNAFDAMEKEGGTLTIETAWQEPHVRVRIGDTGGGIPEDIKNQIFDPFFTTKGIGKGTGLGLDIVSKIISQHKAQINVDSKPGKTVFEICLPATEAI